MTAGRRGGVKLPESWTGSRGHLLTEPWIDPIVRDSFAELVTELEAVEPEGLAHTRTAFRQQGQIGHAAGDHRAGAQAEAGALDQPLNLRFELLDSVPCPCLNWGLQPCGTGVPA